MRGARMNRMRSAGILLLSLALANAGWGQNPAHYAFEVASIRPTQLQPEGRMNVGLRIDGSQFRISAMTLKEALSIAYRVRISQVSGPDWIAGRARKRFRYHRNSSLIVGKSPLKLKDAPADEDDPDPAGTTNSGGGRRLPADVGSIRCVCGSHVAPASATPARQQFHGRAGVTRWRKRV